MNQLAIATALAATLVQLLPPLAVFPSWRRTSEARRWIAIWGVLFFASDLLQLGFSRWQYNNLFLFIFINPVEDGVILWALSYWQLRPVTRIAFRVAIPIVILIYVVIAVAAGENDSFQTFAGPFRALVVMAASLFTLLSRSTEDADGVWTKDWLWATIGVSLYYGLIVAAQPIVAIVAPQSTSAARAVFTVKAIGDVIAFILIWRGMRCPLMQSNYSGST